MIITEGSTDVTVPFYFVDDVAGTAPGEPTTGLLFSDIETGGSASFQRQGAARVDFELFTLANAAAAHTPGGFILVDDTEMPGTYRLDIPDAAVAAGVDFVIIYLRAAAANNTITRPLKIDLTSVDLRDSTSAGISRLDAAISSRNSVTPDVAGTAASLHSTTDALVTARTILAASYFDPAADAVANVTLVATTTTNTDLAAVDVKIDRNADLVESQRGNHTWQGNAYYCDPVNGNDSTGDGSRALPYATIQAVHDDLFTDSNHDVCFLVAGAAAGVTTHTVAATTTLSKRYCFIRGPGRDFIITRTGAGNTIAVTGDGIEISGAQIGTAGTGAGDGINITDADFHRIHHCWFLDTQGDGIHCNRGENMRIHDNHFLGTGVGGTGQGVHISGTAGAASNNAIFNNEFADTAGTSILIENGTILNTIICNNTIHGATGWGINIGADSTDAMVYDNTLGNNSSGNITDAGTTSIVKNNYDVVDGVLDEVNTGATHNGVNTLGRQVRELDEQVGYEGGAIHLNTLTGNPGTEIGTNGTVSNPSSNITDTIAMAVASGRVRIRVSTGSTVKLVANLEGYEIFNESWALQLEGFSISGTCVRGATVTGIGTGSIRPRLTDCQIGAVTLPPSIIKECGIGDSSGTFTFGSAGEYIFQDCDSVVPGSGTPVFVATGLGSATGINNRGWHGGANYTLDSDITMSHEVSEGGGTTITTGGANVEIRGTTRSVSLTLSGAGTVQFVGITGPVTISGTATSTVNLYGVSSSLTDTSSGTTVTDATTSTENVVNEWETQSQADPTGFHVNVLEVGGTAQTANDNGADINAILVDTGEIGTAGAGLSNITLPAAGLDLVLVDGKQLTNALEIIAAGVVGKISGAGTGTEVFVGLTGSDVRATVTVDGSGNRTAVTYA